MDLITIILILVAVVLLIMVAVAGFTAYKKGCACRYRTAQTAGRGYCRLG